MPTDDTTAAIVAAARAVFIRYGVARTRMADVAKEADLARQTLYDFVSGRDQLIELALVACCGELQQRLDAALADGPTDLRDRFVEALALAVEIASTDEEFGALAAALPSETVDRIIGGATAVQALLAKSLRPVLEEADAAGQLRAGVKTDEASQWLLGVISFALLRENHDDAALRKEFRTYAVPSVFTDR
ncbi:AcrR family transcriptional regulator [Mycolicibacterium sp. BK556]|uniref:TetR/AcrR family transcriptional regulator n=1 Tax=unclassified Mycolicibacterium TaxID=2636767 RepID=UPI0016090333|nr:MULTISPECIES: TetR/AcrR family transcriptional regulator [unclassified Mycolicibacterium]MBB3600626.1 AcrR family transcriptional regulator [Mycolicibacterium sp. BK556]MBB3630379.1 AcrR family transcriptional regulator [Mycolicibacterium sp. BK607]